MAPQSKTHPVIYLFCLARSFVADAVQGAGLDPQSPLFLQSYRDLTAVLSSVEGQDFCGTTGESNLQDLQWIAPRAHRHEQIVQQVMQWSPVLPARFGTLFQSAASLEQSLQQHYEPITRFLDWVADKQEWGVKGLLNRYKAREWFFSKALAEASPSLAASPGKRYVQEQRLRIQADKQLWGWLQTITEQVMARLTPFSADRQACRLLKAHQSDPQAEVFLNWAFLVPRTTAQAFSKQLDQFNAQSPETVVTFLLTGPWPPYSFTPSLLAV